LGALRPLREPNTLTDFFLHSPTLILHSPIIVFLPGKVALLLVHQTQLMMTPQNDINDQGFENWQRKQRNGRIVAGVLVIIAGLVYMLHQMEYHIPEWFFKWPTLILGVAVVTAFKHGLRDWRWIVLAMVGGIFMLGYAYPDSWVLQYKIPMVLFIIGAVLIFKPRDRFHQLNKYRMKHSRYDTMFGDKRENSAEAVNEDYIFINNVFAGTEKTFFSKDFKGGEIKNAFGGFEINLMQAEIKDEAVLLINQQFGGGKLIIPSNWVVKSDISCVFAGVEDKRSSINPAHEGNIKTLVLRGSLFMSGLEIVSY
jgi:predicted membrane protein